MVFLPNAGITMSSVHLQVCIIITIIGSRALDPFLNFQSNRRNPFPRGKATLTTALMTQLKACQVNRMVKLMDPMASGLQMERATLEMRAVTMRLLMRSGGLLFVLISTNPCVPICRRNVIVSYLALNKFTAIEGKINKGSYIIDTAAVQPLHHKEIEDHNNIENVESHI